MPTPPRSAWAGSTRKARLPADWPARRARVLARDGYRCRWPGCDARATDVDHVIPGDDHREANLQAFVALTTHERARSKASRHALTAPGDAHPSVTRELRA